MYRLQAVVAGADHRRYRRRTHQRRYRVGEFIAGAEYQRRTYDDVGQAAVDDFLLALPLGMEVA